MRTAILLVPFAADITLKILARTDPDALGRFSFLPSVGTIGLAPSVNSVLAFSLPVPNVWIWPIGWIIVAVLIWVFFNRESHQGSPKKIVVEKLENGNGNEKLDNGSSTNFYSQISKTNFHYPNNHFLNRISQRRSALLILLCGALSNLTDRTFLGGVTDYLSFTDLFPAFNIADFFIVGGIVGWMRSTRERDTSAERSR